MSATNPYAAPSARVEDSVDVRAAEATRREHIDQETAVRAAGLLALVGGALMVSRGVWILLFGMNLRLSLIPLYPLIAPFLIVFGAAAATAGVGLLRLRRWARALAVVLVAIGLMAVLLTVRIGFMVPGLVLTAISAGIGACLLHVLLAPKGRGLFVPEYGAIVAATRHVAYRASLRVWIVLGVMISLCGAFLFVDA